MSGLPLFVLAGLVFVLFGALVSAAVVRAFAADIRRWAPRDRHRVITLVAALPLIIGATLMLASSLPAVISLFVPSLDHCTQHDDVHAHLCFVHVPHVHPSAFVAGALVILCAYGLFRAVRAIVRIAHGLRLVRALAASAEPRHDLGASVIETARPVCFAAGVLHPRVLISRGLLDLLDDGERRIVLAHEQAHVARRDAMVLGIVRALTVFHLPSVGRWILDELTIAAEEACDEAAVIVSGDRLAVAAAILRVERMSQDVHSDFAWVAQAFGPGAVERRVASLLGAPCVERTLRAPMASLGVCVACVFAAAPELHHATESILSFVAH